MENLYYCLKRDKKFAIKDMPKDYCVDCEFFDDGSCWVADLPTKYVEDSPVYLTRPSAKIIQFPSKTNKGKKDE